MKKDQRVQVHFDLGMRQWLQEQAKARHCGVSQIIRDLVLQAMNPPQPPGDLKRGAF